MYNITGNFLLDSRVNCTLLKKLKNNEQLLDEVEHNIIN